MPNNVATHFASIKQQTAVPQIWVLHLAILRITDQPRLKLLQCSHCTYIAAVALGSEPFIFDYHDLPTAKPAVWVSET